MDFYLGATEMCTPSRVSVGLYSEVVERNGLDVAERNFGYCSRSPSMMICAGKRLLDCWRKLIEEGVWSVGPEGIEVTIDTFRDAEPDHWEDYYIPPTW
ncbi:uncharacterized protein N7484_007960 [Penicillium longicatenatum]|uniref:uncharacterized protein n=1 Tax=Penicillium longicatenatum TaxID=1561947 RepID=UPI002548978A|nr:uncharacterized protein N7484_007960 [Penicillium longicatenatum]KAJ5640098.1 hypothetical protein N7484_007960 [Penicillium longicatenatum]